MATTRKCAAGEVRENFADIINEAAYSSTRTVVMRHDKPVAAVIPLADLAILEELERIIDVTDAEIAIAEAEAKGFDKMTTLAQLREKIGL
jgi:PHD/YefM family antitoxin component YafN of YafNO toxin-antitoxin module